MLMYWYLIFMSFDVLSYQFTRVRFFVCSKSSKVKSFTRKHMFLFLLNCVSKRTNFFNFFLSFIVSVYYVHVPNNNYKHPYRPFQVRAFCIRKGLVLVFLFSMIEVLLPHPRASKALITFPITSRHLSSFQQRRYCISMFL